MGKLLALFPLITLFISLSIQGASQQLPSFSELAEASSPAVVNICLLYTSDAADE